MVVLIFHILMLDLVFVSGDIKVPAIGTAYGPVTGIYHKDSNGEFFSYMGIPYAKVENGNLFGDSLEPDPWNEIYEANNDNTVCPQKEQFHSTFIGDVNCLKLNVHTPANISSQTLPVLFWIFGDHFHNGYSGRILWGPEFLVRHNIILVTANYRLGPYGFACLQTVKAPGNEGIKDLIKALKWVSNNIHMFGGDANNVTVGGVSSGASIVDILMYSSAGNDLFNRIIMQSGTSTTKTEEMETSHEKILTIASHFNYTGGDAHEALELLQSIEPLAVVDVVEHLGIKFSFCVEKEIKGLEPILLETPNKILLSGSYRQVDVLLGFSKNEALLGVLEKLRYNEHLTLESMDVFKGLTFKDNNEKQLVVDLIEMFYFKDESKSKYSLYDYEAVSSDAHIIHPMHRIIKYFLMQGANVYYYMFAYSGNRNLLRVFKNITLPGVTHCDEISYIFNSRLLEGLPINCEDRLMIEKMSTMWSNFVKYGNPTLEKTCLLPVPWKPVTKESRNCLIIDKIQTTIKRPFNDRMIFWDLIYELSFKV